MIGGAEETTLLINPRTFANCRSCIRTELSTGAAVAFAGIKLYACCRRGVDSAVRVVVGDARNV